MTAPRAARRTIPLLILLAALPIACGEPGPTPKAGDPPAQAPNATADAGAAPQEPAFLSAEACGRCHGAIYDEWKQSFHGQAMADPLFLELSEDVVNKEECIRCHAPVPLREAQFETPVARASRREDAISCLSCHQDGANIAGPFGGLEEPVALSATRASATW